jgi:hypothetical protein
MSGNQASSKYCASWCLQVHLRGGQVAGRLADSVRKRVSYNQKKRVFRGVPPIAPKAGAYEEHKRELDNYYFLTQPWRLGALDNNS